MKIVYTNRIQLADLDIYECGTEECSPGYACGPSMREFYILHYILDGKGLFKLGDKSYPLEKGKGFLICPGTLTYYQADRETPWHYCWVAFQGAKTETFLQKAGLTPENPVFTVADMEKIQVCFRLMLEADQLKSSRELYLTGLLYQLLSYQVEEYSGRFPHDTDQTRKERYINLAVRFIQANYASDLSLKRIARQVGLDGKYLSALFKEALHISPHRFLMSTRMNKACDLMRNEALSIGDIARSVGYKDPLLFSRMFKKLTGMSPKEYRKSISPVS